MLPVTITVSPRLGQFVARLAHDSQAARGLLADAVRTSAIAVSNGAKERSPVATGTLRRSIRPKILANGLAAVIASYGVPYAVYVEFSEVPHPIIPKGATYSDASGKTRKRYKKGNTNPKATWGFMRKSLLAERPIFRAKLVDVARRFGK